MNNVAKSCNNTVVVIHNAGTRLVDSWIENKNVTAVIFAHLPGQMSGKALVALLYGQENFSGKLPYTVAKKSSDYGDLLKPCQASGIYKKFPQCNFTEGSLIDYRRFDYDKIKPRFEFGYGLSYTTFKYSDLRIAKPNSPTISTHATGPIREGGQTDLFTSLVNVTAMVHNTGSVTGHEVAQLYLSVPGAGDNKAPVKWLRGFDKKTIKPGDCVKYHFELTRRDLSVWDPVAQKWELQSGTYKVMVGPSSQSLPLSASFKLKTS